MNPSDTTAVDPRDDGSNKAERMDQDIARLDGRDPRADRETRPGPDTREEPDSPK